MYPNQKPVLAIDCDDVLNRLQWHFVQWYNKKHGTTYRYEDMYTYDFDVFYNRSIEAVRDLFDVYLVEHKLSTPAEMGSLEGLMQLFQEYELHIVTGRCESMRQLTIDWLQANKMLTLFKDLHFASSYSNKHKSRSKREVCENIGAVALIEDAPVHAVAVAEAGIPVVILSRPWNANLVHGRIHSATNWIRAVTKLQELHGWS